MELIVATGNAHKIEEIKAIIGDKFKVIPITDIASDFNPIENGSTFAENAMIKAKAAHMLTNKPCIADDSGLCVDALGGKPGIHSARYAECGKRKTTLLKELENISDEKRSAHFTSVFAYCDGINEFTAEGHTDGKILFAPSGKGGFGYDPIFYSSELGKSFAAASASEKNAVSHRAKALRRLLSALRQNNNNTQK